MRVKLIAEIAQAHNGSLATAHRYIDALATTGIDAIKFQKMLFLFNSIEQGWTVKKRGDSFVFIKSHEGKKEVLEDAYLKKFMKSNLDLSKIIS